MVKGREAKSLNVLAEFEYIAPEGINTDQSYTLVTQREPDQQVNPGFQLLQVIALLFSSRYQ